MTCAPRGARFVVSGMRKCCESVVIALALSACASSPPRSQPAPTPPLAVRGARSITLKENWRATVIVDRDDSIILTLPSGDHQLQHFARHAGLTLLVDGGGKYSLRLDSMTVRPRNAGDSVASGASWNGVTSDDRFNPLRVSQGGDAADRFSSVIRGVMPRLPAAGVHAEQRWSDTASGTVRMDIFNAQERRTSQWTVGAAVDRGSGRVLPIRVREDFEELGDGSQGGRKMSMTAQGRRSGTYYLTSDGRVGSAQLSDSVAMLISIPSTKQVVPTIRYGRTSVRFILAPGTARP